MDYIDQNHKAVEGLQYPDNGKVLYQEDFQKEQSLIGKSALDYECDRFSPGVISGFGIDINAATDGVVVSGGIGRDPLGRRIVVNDSSEFVLEFHVEKKIVLYHEWIGEEYTPDGASESKTVRKNSGGVKIVSSDYSLQEDEIVIYTVNRTETEIEISPLLCLSELKDLRDFEAETESNVNSLQGQIDTECSVRWSEDVNLQTQIDTIMNILHPIGEYYTQYPNPVDGSFDPLKTPANLYGGVWEQRFSGEAVFFRTEGNDENRDSSGIQGDEFRSHNHSAYKLIGVWDGIDSSTVNSSDMVQTTTFTGFSGGSETRAINRKIKIWERTA